MEHPANLQPNNGKPYAEINFKFPYTTRTNYTDTATAIPRNYAYGINAWIFV